MRLKLSILHNAGPEWKVSNVDVRRVDDGTAAIRVSAELPEVGATYSVTHNIYGTGDIVVDRTYKPGSQNVAMMPRFGTEFVAAPGLENLTWYGRGPVETYIDRQFERIGVYRSTVDKEWVDYSKPQENGNETDVRWVALTNANGVGLLAVGSPALSVTARHFPKEDLERAASTFQMKPRPEVYLNLDGKQMGVGGIDSWTLNAYPTEQYRIASGEEHSFRYRLTPVDTPAAIDSKAREVF